ELLQDLEMCDNDPVAIARCFVMKSEDFDIYTQYCTNYPKIVLLIRLFYKSHTSSLCSHLSY
ncbi:Pleckstrin y domain-containing G member 1, partial [Ataeniobius toweri]|nr:Pleckstrin y domain-containing G member 1 [Ataeniobius toweri]